MGNHSQCHDRSHWTQLVTSVRRVHPATDDISRVTCEMQMIIESRYYATRTSKRSLYHFSRHIWLNACSYKKKHKLLKAWL